MPLLWSLQVLGGPGVSHLQGVCSTWEIAPRGVVCMTIGVLLLVQRGATGCHPTMLCTSHVVTMATMPYVYTDYVPTRSSHTHSIHTVYTQYTHSITCNMRTMSATHVRQILMYSCCITAASPNVWFIYPCHHHSDLHSHKS